MLPEIVRHLILSQLALVPASNLKATVIGLGISAFITKENKTDQDFILFLKNLKGMIQDNKEMMMQELGPAFIFFQKLQIIEHCTCSECLANAKTRKEPVDMLREFLNNLQERRNDTSNIHVAPGGEFKQMGERGANNVNITEDAKRHDYNMYKERVVSVHLSLHKTINEIIVAVKTEPMETATVEQKLFMALDQAKYLRDAVIAIAELE